LWLQKGHPVEAEAGNEKEKDKIVVRGHFAVPIIIYSIF
jgi:hypothetical protein